MYALGIFRVLEDHGANVKVYLKNDRIIFEKLINN